MYKVFCDDYLIYDVNIPDLTLYAAKVALELNKTGSFDFMIYPNHPYFDKLEKLSSTIKVYQDDYLLFRGRILNDDQGFYNEKQVTCEGELAFLLDSVQRPYDFMSGDRHTTIPEFFTFLINNHNQQVAENRRFKVGNITVTDPNNYIVRSDSTYLNTWESINKKLIETNGGFLWVRHEPDGNYLDYLADFDTISNQKIEFGKNLLDLAKFTKGEDIVTAIIPLGAIESETSEKRVDITSVNDGIDYIFDQEAVNKYGWIFKMVTWDDVTLPENLLRKAREYLAEAINLIVTIELSAFDLSSMNEDFNSFRLGMYIPIKTNPHLLNATFLIKKLSIDLLNPQSNKLTIGATYSTFTEQALIDRNSANTVVEKINNDFKQTDTKVSDLQTEVTTLSNDTEASFEQLSSDLLAMGNLFSGKFSSIFSNIEITSNYIKLGLNAKYSLIFDGTSAKFLRNSNNETVAEIKNDLFTSISENRHTIVLQNNWENVGNGSEIACYWIDSSGTIHLSGVIENGDNTVGTVIGTLPTGYIPRAIENFGKIKINTDGEILVVEANLTIISLCGITFRGV